MLPTALTLENAHYARYCKGLSTAIDRQIYAKKGPTSRGDRPFFRRGSFRRRM